MGIREIFQSRKGFHRQKGLKSTAGLDYIHSVGLLMDGELERKFNEAVVDQSRLYSVI
jgi:hypothetical protein